MPRSGGQLRRTDIRGTEETACCAHIYIYIYTSVNPRISILVLNEAENNDAELSDAVTAPLNSFFE